MIRGNRPNDEPNVRRRNQRDRQIMTTVWSTTRRLRIVLPAPSLDDIQAGIEQNSDTVSSALIRIRLRPATAPPGSADTVDIQTRETFAAVGTKLGKLTNLEVTACSFPPLSIAVSALSSCLFQLKDQLESLRLWVNLRGTQEEFEQLFRNMALMTKLKDMACQAIGATIVGSTASPPEMTRWMNDSIINSIKGIETLEAVRVTITQPCLPALEQLVDPSAVSATANRKLELSIHNTIISDHLIQTICGPNSTVHKLRLNDIPNISNVAEGVATGFRNNQSVKELALSLRESLATRDSATREIWTTLLNALQTNTCLEMLRLDANDSVLVPLCGAAEIMPHLEWLDLSIRASRFSDNNVTNQSREEKVFDKLCESLIGKLHQHKKLKDLKIHVHGRYFRPHVLGGDGNANATRHANWRQACNIQLNKALEQMLKTNCHLQDFRIFLAGACLPQNETVAFWLRFNRAGRAGLVENPDDRQRWVDIIVKEKHDTQLVYHLLSKHPSWVLPAIENCEKAERQLKRLLGDIEGYDDIFPPSKRLRSNSREVKVKHDELRREVVQLYQDAAKAPPHLVNSIYACDLETQLKKKPAELVTWLTKFTPVYEDHILEQMRQSRQASSPSTNNI